MLALPILESSIDISLIEEAVRLDRMARKQGLTVLPRDRDYPHLAKVSGLQQRRV